jgi:hypothetical protein
LRLSPAAPLSGFGSPELFFDPAAFRFEIGMALLLTHLPILEAKPGKKVEYQRKMK